MWECQNCHEQVDESMVVCWKCGTSRAGEVDPTFQSADDYRPDASSSDRAHAAVPEATDHDALPRTAGSQEFSPDQQKVVSELGFNMKLVGTAELLAGVLILVAGFLILRQGGGATVLQGGVAFIIGAYTVQAGGAFSRVVNATGDQTDHLMTALQAVRNLYRVHIIALGFLLAAMCISLPLWLF